MISCAEMMKVIYVAYLLQAKFGFGDGNFSNSEKERKNCDYKRNRKSL